MYPRFSKEDFPKNLKLVDGISALAEKKGCTAGQLTLAWLMAQVDDIIPTPGTKDQVFGREHGSSECQVDPKEVKEVRDLVEAAEVHGDRYPSAAMGSLFADTPNL